MGDDDDDGDNVDDDEHNFDFEGEDNADEDNGDDEDEDADANEYDDDVEVDHTSQPWGCSVSVLLLHWARSFVQTQVGVLPYARWGAHILKSGSPT